MAKKNLIVIIGIILTALICAGLVVLALRSLDEPLPPQIEPIFTPGEVIGAVKKTSLNVGNCQKNIDCVLDLNDKSNLKITGRNKEWKDALLTGKKFKQEIAFGFDEGLLGAEVFAYNPLEAASELSNLWLAELKQCLAITGTSCKVYRVIPSVDLTIPDTTEYVKSLNAMEADIQSYL